MSLTQHQAAASGGGAVRVAVVSVSDTRTPQTDAGGALVEELSRAAGFGVVGRHLVADEQAAIVELVVGLAGGGAAGAGARPDAVLLTGGTGFAPRDRTVDALASRFERRMDGFGELFRWLSFNEIGPAAMLSRACAGVLAGGVAVFIMPGSPAAVRLAMQRLIIPELGHLVSELRRAADPPGSPSGAAHPHHHGPDASHRR